MNECIRYHKDMNILQPTLFPQINLAADFQLQVLDPYPIYLLETIRLAAGEAVVVFVSIQIDYFFKSYMTMCQTCVKMYGYDEHC